MNTAPDNSTMNGILAWARLMRISAVPTAATNIVAGFLLANDSWQPLDELGLLVAASCSLYASGMVLNDYCDFEIDCAERPERPLPSGKISKTSALVCYLILTISGLGFSLLAGVKSFVVASAIVGSVLMYSSLLKKTAAAPIVMGICRFLNIMLGASTCISNSADNFLGWPILVWWFAVSLAVMIAGLTRFAQNEVEIKSNFSVISSTLTWATGILGFLTAGVFAAANDITSLAGSARYILLIVLVSLPGLIRMLTATFKNDPLFVRRAVGSIIKSLIFYDAAICFLVKPNDLTYVCVTLFCFVPAFLLSRLISTT